MPANPDCDGSAGEGEQDSLKKACSLLGIGLELHLDQPVPSERAAEIPRTPSAASSGRTPAEDTPKLTRRQLQAIQGQADRAGISDGDLDEWVHRSFGVAVEALDRRQASELITRLNTNASGGNGADGRAAGGVQ